MTGQEVVDVYATGSDRGDPMFAAAGDVATAATVLTLQDGTLALVSDARYNAAGHDVRMELHGSDLEHAMSPVLEERMLAAIGDASTCPHGHPIHAGARIDGVPLADVEEGATVTVLRFENEAKELLHYLKTTGLEPGMHGVVTSAARRQRGDRDVRHRSGVHDRPRSRRDGLGDRGPVTAAARRAARAARHLQRPLRALADGRSRHLRGPAEGYRAAALTPFRGATHASAIGTSDL